MQGPALFAYGPLHHRQGHPGPAGLLAEPVFIKSYGIASQKHYKTMYEGILYGDPKMRVLRILWQEIYQDYNEGIKRGEAV